VSDVLEVVNLRIMGEIHGPSEGSIEAPLTALAELQRQGLIRYLGLSNVTSTQLKQGRSIAQIVCVQNNYNLVHREDDALLVTNSTVDDMRSRLREAERQAHVARGLPAHDLRLRPRAAVIGAILVSSTRPSPLSVCTPWKRA